MISLVCSLNIMRERGLQQPIWLVETNGAAAK